MLLHALLFMSMSYAAQISEITLIHPPSFCEPKNLNIGLRIFYIVLFSAIIGFSLVPKKNMGKYKIALLNGAGIWIGSYEMLFFMLPKIEMHSILMIPIFIAGAVLTTEKELRPLMNALGGVYPICMLIFCLTRLRTKLTCFIFMGIYVAVSYYFFNSSKALGYKVNKVGISSFLTCCILEMFYVNVFEMALYIKFVGLFNVRSLIGSALVVASIALNFFVLPYVVKMFVKETDQKVVIGGEEEGP